jgi:hypothetical protein
MQPVCFKVGLFTLRYDGHSVVTLSATATDSINFNNLLSSGDALRSQFRPTRPGSDWGCDGVGYGAQKAVLQVVLHRSGVGPVNFRRALAPMKRRPFSPSVAELEMAQ